MKQKTILIGLVFLLMIMMPTDVRAFPELTHDSGTETIQSGSYGHYFVVHYTIYDDVDFGGYFNITDDEAIYPPSAHTALLNMFILNAENWAMFPDKPYECDKLFELWDVNITTGRVAWNYTQYTSIEYVVSMVYWLYYPTWQERRITFDYEHWDWARYQPPVETTTTTTTTAPTTTTTTTTITTTDPTTEDTIDTTTGDDNGLPSIVVVLGIAGTVGIVVIGIVVFRYRKRTEMIGGKGVKVLVICPYCGGKTEQGVMKCGNCGATL